MENSAEYFTISIPCELEGALSLAQNRYYCGVSQTEMIQDLIRRGLQASNAPQNPNALSPDFYPIAVRH